MLFTLYQQNDSKKLLLRKLCALKTVWNITIPGHIRDILTVSSKIVIANENKA